MAVTCAKHYCAKHYFIRHGQKRHASPLIRLTMSNSLVGRWEPYRIVFQSGRYASL